MIKILTISLFALGVTIVLSASAVDQTKDNDEALSIMMENLAEHTVNINSEVLTQLLANTEQTNKSIASNIEKIIASAKDQLMKSIQNFEMQLASSQCQPLVTLQQLTQQVDSDLSKCTQNMKEILKTLQQDVNELKVAFEKSIKEIIDLPKKCQGEGGGADFISHLSCYIGNISGFNQQVAVIFNNASDTIVHTRQLGEKALQDGRTCATNVIVTTRNAMDKILSTCQFLKL